MAELDFPVGTFCALMGACEPVDPVDGACDGCMIGFTLLEDIWNYGPSIELMESLLDYICNIFPAGEFRT